MRAGAAGRGAFAEAIGRLLDDGGLSRTLGDTARARAEERWSKTAILGRFERQLVEVAGKAQRLSSPVLGRVRSVPPPKRPTVIDRPFRPLHKPARNLGCSVAERDIVKFRGIR